NHEENRDQKEEELKNQGIFKDGYRYPATWYRYPSSRQVSVGVLSQNVTQQAPKEPNVTYVQDKEVMPNSIEVTFGL
ncbi:hypothetical protein PIB30_058753, partial [Stylosanthes scabra]|nr:hypothetical protein [Stylosanthes scabra]